MSEQRGAIRNIDAYARGKMLDHSSWQLGEQKLPRLITPSDIDMVFDNRGWALFCEISRKHSKWSALRADAKGQHDTYLSTIKNTVHCAVLCKHSVSLSAERAIDTRNDIESFQVMLYDPRLPLLMANTEIFTGNGRWQRFVFRWFESPEQVRLFCVESAVQNEAA